jgi:hypothetical protein
MINQKKTTVKSNELEIVISDFSGLFYIFGKGIKRDVCHDKTTQD